MKLFEFDIAWDQPVSEQFDQDDIKVVGTRRVGSDAVRVVAHDSELALLALQRAFTHRNMKINNVREFPINIFVDYTARTLVGVQATRVLGATELNDLGRLMENRAR